MRIFLGVAFSLLLAILAFYLYLGRPTHQTGVDVSGLTANATGGHIENLQHSDVTTRRKAARALWLIGMPSQEATAVLVEAVKDNDAQVREFAAKALGRASQGTATAIAILANALGDKEPSVRTAAAGALAELWTVDKAPGAGGAPIPTASQGADASRHKPASDKLSSAAVAAARPVIPTLTRTLCDPDARVRAQAARALTEAGPLAEPAVEELCNLLGSDTDGDARLHAILALASIGPGAKNAVPVLLKRLRDDDRDGNRGNAGVALGRIRAQPETVVPALVEAFLREDWGDTRGMIVMGLAEFGAEAQRAVPLLEAALKDPKTQQKPDVLQGIDRVMRLIKRFGVAPDTPKK